MEFQFDSLMDFIQMGRHGVYVWTAYGVSLMVIVGNVLVARNRHRQQLRQIARHQRRESRA